MGRAKKTDTSETGDDDLITLQQAAALIPGADPGTLKRRARQGLLTVYRPGRAYLTTRPDVKRMVQQRRVVPKVRDSGSAPPAPTPPAGSPTRPTWLSEMEMSSAQLDAILTKSKKPPKRRRPE
jgi:hypothetical protein